VSCAGCHPCAADPRPRCTAGPQVLLRPRTGRSHQLRVHLHAQGSAILGDEIYVQTRPAVFLRATPRRAVMRARARAGGA